jgi:hypothetical protein
MVRKAGEMGMAWTMSYTQAAALSLSFVGLLGCNDKDKNPPEPKLAPSASVLAPSTAAPTDKIVKLSIDPASKSSIDMPAPKEHIKADTTAAAGNLDIDVVNLANSRGDVKVDLSTLTTKTFDSADQNATQTGHARCWLEVADCEHQKLEDALKTSNKYADYAIRSIDGLSATDLSKVPPTKDGPDDVRTVTMTTHGELLIHGHKVDREAQIEVTFHYPSGGPPDKPSSVVVKTKTPLHVVLAEHDVKPRDDTGKIAKAAFHLLGTKVADSADISLEIRAVPQP